VLREAEAPNSSQPPGLLHHGDFSRRRRARFPHACFFSTCLRFLFHTSPRSSCAEVPGPPHQYGPLQLGQPLPRGLRGVHRYGFAPVISGECASVGGVYNFEFLASDEGMLFYGNDLSILDLRDAKYRIMVLAVAPVKKENYEFQDLGGYVIPELRHLGSVRGEPFASFVL